MTFKKVLGLIALACLTIIGLSACTPDKESTWTYDKNKMQFVGQDASVCCGQSPDRKSHPTSTPA